MKKILNIILGVLLAVMAVLGIYAIATGGSEASISLNLIWCYVLLALAIASAIFCSHDTVITDFASGGVFPRTPTVIADCGIIVTYVAMIAAVVVALYSEVAKLFK